MHLPEPNSTTEAPTLSLYNTDFYAWTQEQTALLRQRQWNQIDLQNLIEEIESLGKQQRQELRNRLSVLIGQLLKWQHQPQHRSRSWLVTLRIQRLDITDLLEESPSLKPTLRKHYGALTLEVWNWPLEKPIYRAARSHQPVLIV